MANRSLIGGLAVGIIGAAATVGSYFLGRGTKTADDNDEAADNYLDKLDNDATDSDENSDDED